MERELTIEEEIEFLEKEIEMYTMLSTFTELDNTLTQTEVDRKQERYELKLSSLEHKLQISFEEQVYINFYIDKYNLNPTKI